MHATPDATPQPRNTDGGRLREALHARDQALGLMHGGAVVGAAHDAAFASYAHDGRAVIEVDLDANGNATGAHVLSVSSDASAWADVARAIAEALRARRISLPTGARGLVVTVAVDLSTRLPSGAKGVTLEPNGIGGGIRGDVSDIGAHGQRVVSVKFLGERGL